jgi:hypothetical protein
MAMLSSYQADIAEYEIGGIVPMTGLAKVHAGETILPASMSGKGDFGIMGGTYAPRLVVNAVDGDGVQRIYNSHIKPMMLRDISKYLASRGFQFK